MHIAKRKQLDYGESLRSEIESLHLISAILLDYDDITALKLCFSVDDWFQFQKKAAEVGQKKAVAVLNNITIFQKDL